jgi:non-specific protein-tyrosine kinase
MEIRKYLSLVFNWWWLIILATLITGSVTYLVSKSTAPVYSATTRLLIDESSGGGANDYVAILTEQKQATTLAQLVEARPVLEETIRRLNLPFSTNVLAGNISVSAPTDTQILIIRAEDIDRERVAEIANTIAEVFVEQNVEIRKKTPQQTIDNTQATIDEKFIEFEELQTEIASLEALTEPENVAKLSSLNAQSTAIELEINNLAEQQRANRAELARASNNNLIQFEEAIAPNAPIRPSVGRNTVLGLVVGAMLAVGMIFLIDYLDDTVKSPDDIQEDTGLSTLGIIALIQGKEAADKLVTLAAPRAPISEAFRVLRTNLGFSAIDSGLRSMLITSSSPGEGKSTVVGNLGVVMAQTGKRVIVVDADLRLPTQHKVFGTPNNQGLTTALLDTETPVSQHLQNTRVPGLRIMTSGPLPPNPAELLNSQRMIHIIEELKQECDLVIFDTPPILTVTDAAILGRQVDGCTLVAEVGKTNRSAVIRAIEGLLKADANVFGVVLNKLQLKRMGYYDYYYHYQYYAYDYSQKQPAHRRQSRIPAWISGLTNRS